MVAHDRIRLTGLLRESPATAGLFYVPTGLCPAATAGPRSAGRLNALCASASSTSTSCPRPWDPGAEEKLLQDALDQVELADRVGFDYVWEVEHHFLEEYSHSRRSEVFLAAASQRTKNIRLGLGIVPMPPGYKHPARVAETVATLDLVSGGRVEFGTGETSSGAELGGFGVDRETKREQWDEALDAITRMFVEEPFAGLRRALRVDAAAQRRPQAQAEAAPAAVGRVLAPRDDPAGRRAGHRRADLLVRRAGGGEGVGRRVLRRSSSPTTACRPASPSTRSVAVVLPMMCTRDEATAIERGIDGAHFFGYSLAHYYVFGDHRPGLTNVWEEFQAAPRRGRLRAQIINADDGPLGVKILQQGLGSLRGAIGTPEQVRELCRRYEAAGVDQVIFVLQAGRNRHEHICESLELFGAEVLPEFAERRRRARPGQGRAAGGRRSSARSRAAAAPREARPPAT